MLSMTGFGRGVIVKDTRKITIEVKSVNGRYLDIIFRMPRSLGFIEEVLRQTINSSLKRGSVEVIVHFENTSTDTKKVVLDFSLANEFVEAAKTLRTQYMLDYDFNTTALLRSPEVAKIEFSDDDPVVITALAKNAITAALEELIKMRKAEGAVIKANLKDLSMSLATHLKKIEKRVPFVISDYRKKLTSRIVEVLQSVEIDQARLLNEVAFFADKVDISEEINRLYAHLEQFNKSLELSEPIGRKLDFISQEIHREANTLGIKCTDIETTAFVLLLKNDLEKIKEQIRNVE